MSLTPRDRLWRLVAQIGFLVAPAGLNFAVPGTTWWLYSVDSFAAGPRRLRPVGLRVPFEAEALRQNEALVRVLDALWVRRLSAAAPRLARPQPPLLLRRLDALCAGLPGLPLRPLALRTAALLSALRFCPEYHPERGPGTGYLFDLLENGLTVLAIEPARRALSSRTSRP